MYLPLLLIHTYTYTTLIYIYLCRHIYWHIHATQIALYAPTHGLWLPLLLETIRTVVVSFLRMQVRARVRIYKALLWIFRALCGYVVLFCRNIWSLCGYVKLLCRYTVMFWYVCRCCSTASAPSLPASYTCSCGLVFGFRGLFGGFIWLFFVYTGLSCGYVVLFCYACRCCSKSSSPQTADILGSLRLQMSWICRALLRYTGLFCGYLGSFAEI